MDPVSTVSTVSTCADTLPLLRGHTTRMRAFSESSNWPIDLATLPCDGVVVGGGDGTKEGGRDGELGRKEGKIANTFYIFI